MDPKPEFDIQMIINSDLNKHTKAKLIEYCEDSTVHSIHLLTYQEFTLVCLGLDYRIGTSGRTLQDIRRTDPILGMPVKHW